MSDFDFTSVKWTVRRCGDQWSVIEQPGGKGTRYWFGPMKKDEVPQFIDSRKSCFAEINRRRS